MVITIKKEDTREEIEKNELPRGRASGNSND
jgi:hypothetical protein